MCTVHSGMSRRKRTWRQDSGISKQQSDVPERKEVAPNGARELEGAVAARCAASVTNTEDKQW